MRILRRDFKSFVNWSRGNSGLEGVREWVLFGAGSSTRRRVPEDLDVPPFFSPWCIVLSYGVYPAFEDNFEFTLIDFTSSLLKYSDRDVVHNSIS